jgi:O-acetylhomoserine/O-acetylserine sulfhydrylase-like pyridoxal-dependent enzyme
MSTEKSTSVVLADTQYLTLEALQSLIGWETGYLVNRLEMIKRATNVYDNKTLILHPASTIYCDFSQERRLELQIREETIRLSLGIEDVEDIKSDILQALSD